MMTKWAERLVQIKKKFHESWVKISDQVALDVLKLLKSREIEFNQVFDRMIEFAVQLYLLSLSFENNETDSQDLLNLLEELPEGEKYSDVEKTTSFKQALKNYFKVSSDEQLWKIFGISRQALNSRFNKWFISMNWKARYRAVLEKM